MVVATPPELTEPLQPPPDVVWEVRHEDEGSWLRQYAQVIDYLRAGASVVVVLDEATTSALVYRPSQCPQIFEKDQTLTMPDVLPGFEVPVARFFEE